MVFNENGKCRQGENACLWLFGVAFAGIHLLVQQCVPIDRIEQTLVSELKQDNVWGVAADVIAINEKPVVPRRLVQRFQRSEARVVRDGRGAAPARTRDNGRRHHKWQRRQPIRPGSNLCLTNNERIARRALIVAKNMNTVGWCLRGVSAALQPLGIHLSGGAAYQAKEQLARDKRFREVEVEQPGHLVPGDIIVHDASEGHKHGHIAVYVGNEREASDHVQPVIINGSYKGCTVFRTAQVAAQPGRQATR